MQHKWNKIIFFISMIFLISSCTTTKSSENEKDEKNKKIATAKINTQLGMTYLEQHNIQRAKLKLLMALDEAPTIPEVWYAMGYFLEATGDKEQANQYYLKAVAIAPTRGDVQNNYGTYLCRNGQYQAAIEHFQIAVKDINYVAVGDAYENAGLCASKLPDKHLAFQFLNKAIEQDPDRANVYMDIAELNFQIGNYNAAKINLEHFLQLTPPTKESYQLTDQLEKKLGKTLMVGEL